MIVETAYMTIAPGSESDFESAMSSARELVEQTPGCRGLFLRRGVERPSVYLVEIHWEQLSDHLQGFRESERFGQWRALLSPYFAADPVVEHWADQQ